MTCEQLIRSSFLFTLFVRACVRARVRACGVKRCSLRDFFFVYLLRFVVVFASRMTCEQLIRSSFLFTLCVRACVRA